MDVVSSIEIRKSIRRYKDLEVSEKDLREVLKAGVLAPSAKNKQNWKFIAVRDKETNLKLREACGNQKMVGEAPVTIVILGKDDHIMSIGQSALTVDCSIALSFMMLRATELGLGTCWLGRVFSEQVKEILDIPDEYTVVAVTPLGYPAEEGRVRTRKDFDEVVSFEKF